MFNCLPPPILLSMFAINVLALIHVLQLTFLLEGQSPFGQVPHVWLFPLTSYCRH